MGAKKWQQETEGTEKKGDEWVTGCGAVWLRGSVQIRFEERAQLFRQSLRFFVKAGADVKGFGFEKKELLVENSIGEVQANAIYRDQPRLNGEDIIIPRGCFVAQPALDDGKNQVLLLQFEKGCAEMPKEFSTR